MTRLRRRIHGLTCRGQEGFALLLTLGLMAFFAVSVVALLGLTLNTAGISTLQAGTAAKERAADGAIDASINAISRTDVGTYDAGPDCSGGMPTELDINDYDPKVACRALEPTGVNVPEVGSTRSLKVIGEGTYGGTPPLHSIQVAGPAPMQVVGATTVAGATSGDIDVGGEFTQAACPPEIDVGVHASVETCGGAVPTDTDLPGGPAAAWRPKTIAGNWQGVPPCPPSGSVTLTPGSYHRDQVSEINDRIESCTNVNFPPGDYWFDADDSAPGPDRNSLVIANPDTSVVFGTLSNGQCSGTVDITLSAQTSILHGAGKVTICGTIRQPAKPPMPWRVEPADMGNLPEESTVCNTPESEFSFHAGNQLPARVVFDFPPFSGCYEDVATVRFTFGDLSPNTGPISSAVLHLTSSSTVANGPSAGVHIEVWRAGSPSMLCWVEFPHIPYSTTNVAYDLLAPSGTCDDSLADRSQLSGAEVRVRYRVQGFLFDSDVNDPPNVGGSCFVLEGDLPRRGCVEITDVSLSAGWTLTADTAASVTGTTNFGGAGPEGARAPGGSRAELTVPVGNPREFVAGFSGFRFEGSDPFVPTDGGISGLGVLVTGTSKPASYPVFNVPVPSSASAVSPNPGYPPNTYIVAKLEYPSAGGGTATCAAMTGSIPLWGEAVYIDMATMQIPTYSTTDPSAPPPPPVCDPDDFTDARSLEAAELFVEVRAANATNSWFTSRRTESVEYLDAVQLVVSPAGDYDHPDSPNHVVQGNGNSFNVMGEVVAGVVGGFSTAHNDLEVTWSGQLTDPRRPMVDGSMVVHSIKSSGDATGVICCEVGRPAERIVELTASVDSKPTSRALVRFNDLPDLGTTVDVRSWLICRTQPSGCQP